MTKKHRQIKTAIIVDMMGCGGRSQEDEIAEYTERFGRLLAPAKLKTYTPYHAGEGDHGLEPGTELVIYDYGGLMPGNSLMEDNARAVIKWAENHPNGLVIVVSSFTYSNFIRIELEQQGLDLFNVICDDSWTEDAEEKLIPEWFKTAR
jgi:hypothetical protein